MKGRRFILALLLVGIVALIPIRSDAGDTIKVGIIGPMTGPQAYDIGLTMRDGARLAMEEINEKGGIAGKKFEWIVIDDEASPAKSVAGAKKLVFRDKIDILIGPANSGCALAVGEITVPNKIINVVPGQRADLTSPERDYVFRCSITDKEIAKKMMLFAGDTYKKFAVIHDTTGYGADWYKTMMGALALRGIKPVADESFEIYTPDLTPQVLRIKESGAEILIWLSVGADVPTLAKAEKRIGLNIPHLGTNGFGGVSVVDLGGDDVNGFIFPDTVDVQKKKWQEFADRYRKRFGYPELITNHPPSQAYDAIYMLAQALEKTKGATGEALKNAIEAGVSIDGVTCKIGTGGMSWKKDKHDAMVAEQLAMIMIQNKRFVAWSGR
jgi:branched-chain amino acid transport system substrate-binding protein